MLNMPAELQVPWATLAYWKGGVLTVTARCIGEMKFIITLLAAAKTANNVARRSADRVHCVQDTADACALQGLAETCSERLVCIAENIEELKHTQGYRTSDPFDQTSIALLMLVAVANMTAVLACIHKIATDAEWKREWSTVGSYSDVMLCFRINKEYAAGQMRLARYITLAVFFTGLAVGSTVAYFRGSLAVMVDSEFVIVLIAAFVSAQQLWLPDKRLAKYSFRTYQKHLPEHWFEWADLLSSAPTVIQDKFNAAAIEEEYEEMEEEREGELLAA